MPQINRMIATDNIAQFERQIKAENDASKREILRELLAKEKAKLWTLDQIAPQGESGT
jgi:hypothetical protein